MSSSESAVEWLLMPRSKSIWRPRKSSVLLLLFVLAAGHFRISNLGYRVLSTKRAAVVHPRCRTAQGLDSGVQGLT